VARVKGEAKVSRDIREFLQLVGCSSVYSTEQGYRYDRGGTRQSPGIPDLLVFGTEECPFFFIEVKGPKGKLRPSQVIFQEECGKAGMPYLVAHDVRDVFDFLVEKGVVTTP